MKWFCIVLLIAAGVALGCRKKAPDPFPVSAVAGWQKTGATQAYTAENLWQYLDGGADEYVNAGLVSASTSDYTFRGKLEAVVDVYTMQGADGARKILESEPASGQHAAVGDDARLYAQSVVFRKGSSLVRITTYEAAPGDALLALAHAVEGRL